MIDVHAHLTFPQYKDDLADALARAHEAGVEQMVVPGTDEEHSRQALALAETEPRVFAAVGVHPQDVGSATEQVFAHVRDLASRKKVVALGEVGLERSSRAPDMHVQIAALRQFASCALELNLPMIFHVRDAHAEFREFLEGVPGLHGVVHCFSGTLDDATSYLDYGLQLSITGIVTFPNAQSLRDIVKEVPLSRLLIETDSPFLAPQAHRGQRNEPAYVTEVAKAIASVKGIGVEEVGRVTDDSARTLFRLPQP